MHYIQKYILKTLTLNQSARFRDMRPPKVDSNAYSYHLKALQKDLYVEKNVEGYTLSPKGLAYVDKVSLEKFEPRLQPKLTNMLVIHNEYDEILLLSKSKQPFIKTWMLPYGKVHLEDKSLFAAAIREADEKLHVRPENLQQVGSCFIQAHSKGELVSSIVGYVFTGKLNKDQVIEHDAHWYSLQDLDALTLAPATKEIICKTQENQGLFFEQYETDSN